MVSFPIKTVIFHSYVSLPHWIFAPFSISSSLPILAKHQGPPFGVAMPGHLRREFLRNRRNLGIVDAAKDPPCSRRNRLWVSSFNHSLNRFIHIYPNKPMISFSVLGYTKSAGNVVSRYFWWCWFMSWLTGGDNWMGNYNGVVGILYLVSTDWWKMEHICNIYGKPYIGFLHHVDLLPLMEGVSCQFALCPILKLSQTLSWLQVNVSSGQKRTYLRWAIPQTLSKSTNK